MEQSLDMSKSNFLKALFFLVKLTEKHNPGEDLQCALRIQEWFPTKWGESLGDTQTCTLYTLNFYGRQGLPYK